MSSPITLSGFNNIDFGSIINSILQQERAPINALTTAQYQQKAKLDAYGQLGSKLSAFDAARSALDSSDAFHAVVARTDDDSLLSVSAGSVAAAGSHTVTVTSLATTQVLASTSLSAAADTVVADGGTLTVGATTYSVTASTTLLELRDQINADASGKARASLVDTGSGYRLVLTAKDTGTTAAFTVSNDLTLAGGAPAVAFADANADGTSGDSASDNAVNAVDASLLVDNVAVTRGSNVVTGALAGVTLTLKSEGTTTVHLENDLATTQTRIQDFVDSFNDLSHFLQSQFISSGTAGPLAGDFTARTVSGEIRSVLRSAVTGSGAFKNLAEIGLVFERTGDIQIDGAKLSQALSETPSDVEALFRGTGGSGAILSGIGSVLDRYLGSSGVLSAEEGRFQDAISSLDRRIADMQDRLDLREQALRLQFSAADQAISSLNTQLSALGGLGLGA